MSIYDELEESQCAICFEDVQEDDWIIFDCGHKICVNCLQKLFYHTKKSKDIDCPFCRVVIDKADKKVINTHQTSQQRPQPQQRQQRPRQQQPLQDTHTTCQLRQGLCIILNIVLWSVFFYFISQE